VAANEILAVVSALDQVLGRQPNLEIALSIIQEAGLG